MIVRRPRAMGHYGLGMDYNGLLAQAGLENCGDFDVACATRNAQKQAAVEDLWGSTYMRNPNGAPDDLKLLLGPVGTDQAIAAFNNNQILQPAVYVSSPKPPEPPPAPIETLQGSPTPTKSVPVSRADGTAVSRTGGVPSNTAAPPPGRSRSAVSRTGGVPSRVPAMITPKPASGATATTTVVNSSGSSQPPQTVVSSPSSLFDALPWWGWAAAGVGILFAFSGGGRGR